MVLAHAALLFDFSTLSPESTATTSVSPDALSSSKANIDAQTAVPTHQRVSSVRWVGSPPATTLPTPRPPVLARPAAPTPEPAPVEISAAAPSETPEPMGNQAPAATPKADTPAIATAPKPPSVSVAPTQTRLVYDITGEVKGRSVFAEGLLEWTVKDGRYDASLAVRMVLLGTRTQTSVGRIGPQGLMPERFGERQRDDAATHFDYEGQRVRFSRNRPDAPLLPGTQDRLSVILQLAVSMHANPQDFQTGREWSMPVASSREVENWRWLVGELETLALPKGSVSARHLTRPAMNERDSTIELWMAPTLQHLPVRIRITQSNGDWLDQRLVLAP